jgi:hypothetical protein
MYGRAVRSLATREGAGPLQLNHWRFPAVHTFDYDFFEWLQRPAVPGRTAGALLQSAKAIDC